jgi:GT2 family glycosyltransferase
MTFTAVVVIHDSAPELERLMASLAHLAEAPQLVVVDSGSRDPGADLARQRGANVVELPGNLGFGAATNEGVSRARSDVVALLNPDVELLDDGLLDLADRARGRDVLLAPRLLNVDGTVQRSAHPLPGRAGALLPALLPPALLPAPLRLRAEPWRSDTPRPVGWAVGAALVARRDLLRSLGPFDPAAFLFYEDLDLCLRARAAGVPTELRPEVRLRHAGGHATGPAFGGEAHDLRARRRREVVAARLGARALRLDDAAQALTFATRAGARFVLRRDAERERARLRALLRARRPAQ